MTGQYFSTDCTVRLEGDAVCLTFLRGEDGGDVAEVWIPASKAVHAGAALLEVYFGRLRAAKVADRLHLEWELEQFRAASGWLPEAEQSDFEEAIG